MGMTATFNNDGEVREGSFERQQSEFRDQPEGGPERHHLYVALACPRSHRAVIARAVKGLEGRLGMSLCDPYRVGRGWAVSGERFTDPINGFQFLREGYPDDFAGRVTVPVLWDKEAGRLVNNESSDIMRILDRWGDGPELYPEALRPQIDAVNAWVYGEFQNGVYRAGFARSQEAYEGAFFGVFAALDRMEALLGDSRCLIGDEITEADWRVLPTLVRFDAVYHTHFRCNGRRLLEYPNLIRYARELFNQPGIPETFALDEIKRHYYTTHDELNPKRIIPAGPFELGFTD